MAIYQVQEENGQKALVPRFDSNMTTITVISETNRSSSGGYVDVRIVYI